MQWFGVDIIDQRRLYGQRGRAPENVSVPSIAVKSQEEDSTAVLPPNRYPTVTFPGGVPNRLTVKVAVPADSLTTRWDASR